MKRKDIVKLLRDAGVAFNDGGNHTRSLKNGRYVIELGRHYEIDDRMVKVIERQTGIRIL